MAATTVVRVRRPSRSVVRTWPAAHRDDAFSPRDGLVAEVAQGESDGGEQRFVQHEGPFQEYERVVRTRGHEVVDTTTYRLTVPWFGWLFRLPVRSSLKHRSVGHGAQPGWAPPDRLTPHHVMVLGLLAAVSLSSAFVNTLFTQTANFAASDFGISEQGQGIAGVIVRCGIVFALPFTVLADRLGRRRMIVILAWAAPLLAVTGAFAPNFWVLPATQTVARPLGIAAQDTVAFGDMPNDIPMLLWAGHGVAMGNAHPEAVAAANEVTESNDEDGLARVLERWWS